VVRGRWVFVSDQDDKGSSGSPLFMWLIFIAVGVSLLYGIIRPDYEYYPVDGSCDEERKGILGENVISEDYYCKQESLIYEKWLFSDKISGEIMAAARENEHGVNISETAINFEGRVEEGILIIELDSIGTIWNNGSTLEVKILGDTLLRYRGRELVGGRSWFNFPFFY
jgi:hypothetical protein